MRGRTIAGGGWETISLHLYARIIGNGLARLFFGGKSETVGSEGQTVSVWGVGVYIFMCIYPPIHPHTPINLLKREGLKVYRFWHFFRISIHPDTEAGLEPLGKNRKSFVSMETRASQLDTPDRYTPNRPLYHPPIHPGKALKTIDNR